MPLGLLRRTLTPIHNDAQESARSVVALKIELKANERVIIGDCVITNVDQRARLLIEGKVPILREKDIMSLSRADSPAKRIYLAIQLMYTAKRPEDHHALYFRLVRDIIRAAPSTRPFIDRINNRILTGEFYKALKETRKLIDYEKGLLDNALCQQGLRTNGEGDGLAAPARSKSPIEGGRETAGGARVVARKAHRSQRGAPL
jgi:flagellar biosynthesis repressor protein FlbT